MTATYVSVAAGELERMEERRMAAYWSLRAFIARSTVLGDRLEELNRAGQRRLPADVRRAFLRVQSEFVELNGLEPPDFEDWRVRPDGPHEVQRALDFLFDELQGPVLKLNSAPVRRAHQIPDDCPDEEEASG